MRVFNNITGLIGHTPLVEINRFTEKPLAVGEKRHTRAGVRKCGKQCVFPRSVHPIDEDALELSRSAFDGGLQGTVKISRIVRSLCGHGK